MAKEAYMPREPVIIVACTSLVVNNNMFVVWEIPVCKPNLYRCTFSGILIFGKNGFLPDLWAKPNLQ